MKNYTTIIILFVGIGGAVVAYTFTQSQQAKQAEAQYLQYVQKYKTQQAAQPNPLATPTPTISGPVTAASLSNDAQSLSDDGGASDFSQLQNDIGGL